MFLFRNQELEQLKQQLQLAGKEKQILMDKNNDMEIRISKVEQENKQLRETLSKLKAENEKSNDIINTKPNIEYENMQKKNLCIIKINKELLARANLAEKFETAERFHKFLESIGKTPKLLSLISNLEKDNKDVEKMGTILQEKEKRVIESASSYLFEFMNENQEKPSTIEGIKETSLKIDNELNQIKLNELDEIEKQKEQIRKKKIEDRFGKELFTDEDIMKYGNTPGNIANGGGCCIYGDRVFIGFKNGIVFEYSKKTGKKICEYAGYDKKMLAVMHDELYYGSNFDMYYDQFNSLRFDWGSQIIYDGNLYFINSKDGNRIYYTSLVGQDPRELCINALPVRFSIRAYMRFSSEWLYYNNIDCLARINLKNNKFEVIGSSISDNFICTNKGIYCGILGKIGDYNLYFFSHKNPKGFILILKDVINFNLHKNKIVFSFKDKIGLFVANPDGSNIKQIAQYAAFDIYIINDWVYFQDSNAFEQRSVFDYYRVRIDGTGLTRLKEGEPLYVVD